MASVVVVILLTAVAWVWAVRRPVTAGGPVEARPPGFAAIGASDVVGVGANDPGAESWVTLLHRRMPEGTRFVRLGRSGITLSEVLQVEVPQALAARPDIVTMWACINDVL